MSDPRVFFAAERTLLAWIRSGITIIGLGFVVSRFGLFLRLLPAAASGMPGAVHPHWLSNTLGIALVLLGSAAILAALFNHRAFVRSLPAEDVPYLGLPWLTPALALSLSLLGLLMAAYLALA